MGIPRVAVIGIVGVVLAAAAFLFTRQPAAPEPAPAVPAAQSVSPAPQGDTRNATKPVSETSVSDKTPAEQVPDRVTDALEDGKVVVLMFAQSGGADDKATRAAVRRLHSVGSSSLGRHFEVFTDGVADLADYTAVVGNLGIDQAPATVILAPDGEARLVQGFVDGRSLRQYVADALG